MHRSGSTDRSKVALGRWGEQLVADWYAALGYRVLDRNWYGSRGEIDLVLARDDEIVFCEVKTRASDRYGSPAEAVDHRKQRRLRRLAVEWLRGHHRSGSVRFDVASVLGGRVSVIHDAF